MRLLVTLLLLLLVRPAELRRGHRSRAVDKSPTGRVRGRGRSGVMRRQTQECKEYMEAGEKYLDCQDRQLTSVMQDWPKDIHHLLLARNKIQVHTVKTFYTCTVQIWGKRGHLLHLSYMIQLWESELSVSYFLNLLTLKPNPASFLIKWASAHHLFGAEIKQTFLLCVRRFFCAWMSTQDVCHRC